MAVLCASLDALRARRRSGPPSRSPSTPAGAPRTSSTCRWTAWHRDTDGAAGPGIRQRQSRPAGPATAGRRGHRYRDHRPAGTRPRPLPCHPGRGAEAAARPARATPTAASPSPSRCWMDRHREWVDEPGAAAHPRRRRDRQRHASCPMPTGTPTPKGTPTPGSPSTCSPNYSTTGT